MSSSPFVVALPAQAEQMMQKAAFTESTLAPISEDLLIAR
jgi:hypothetical protein